LNYYPVFTNEAIKTSIPILKRNENYEITPKEIKEGESFIEFNLSLVSAIGLVQLNISLNELIIKNNPLNFKT
jgi:hypothetical protein